MGFDPAKSGYVDVATRHTAFVEKYPEGRIETKIVRFAYDPAEKAGVVVVEARVWKNKDNENPDGTGLSQMQIPGSTGFTRGSEVENAETSAIGRALGWIGFHPKEQIASKDEIRAKQSDPVIVNNEAAVRGLEGEKATQGQINKMFAMAGKAGVGPDALKELVKNTTGKFSSKQLTQGDMDSVFTALTGIIEGSSEAAPVDDADLGVDEVNPLA